MNVKTTNCLSTRSRFIGFLLAGLAACLQACSTSLPQNAHPIVSKIATVLGTTEFILDSNIRYTNGCRFLSLGGCYTDFWDVCIRFNNVAAYKKATRNNYAGPDADLEFARNSGASITFRNGEWSRYIEHDVNCPSIRCVNSIC